ncbi:MAG: hypothetical protein ABMB14_28620, partial [Myxococcota bacterium]
MSLFDTLGAGLSGLTVASAGIQTTTHNVSNASTAGFTRRRIDVSSADPLRRGPVWLGQGARVDGVSRATDPFALGRLYTTTGDASSAAAAHAGLVSFEGLFEPTSGTSLRQAVDGLFDAFQGATADPADPNLRTEVVSAAQRFATTVSG